VYIKSHPYQSLPRCHSRLKEVVFWVVLRDIQRDRHHDRMCLSHTHRSCQVEYLPETPPDFGVFVLHLHRIYE
jgi:hypothetical protein